MYSLIKSDLLKLRWSNIWVVSFILIMLMILIQMYNPGVSFLASGDINTLTKSIGFISNIEAGKSYNIYKIIRASMSFTVFYWIVILSLSLSFFIKEYKQRTINLTICNGVKRSKIYISKLIVTSIFSFLLYVILTSTIFIFIANKVNYNLSIKDITLMFKILFMNFLAVEVFIILTFFIGLVVRNVILSNTIMIIYIFTGIMIYMNTWDSMESQNFLIKIFLKTNPIYYWSTISAYNFKNNIIIELIVYFLIVSFLGISLSNYVIKKQELK